MTPQIGSPLKDKARVSFAFGEAPEWYLKIFHHPHYGVDFAVTIGTPVRACDDGKITYADSTPDYDGLGINMEHPWGLSQYWHLSRLTASLGTNFKRGQVIGFSGDSGVSTGPHLHFGVKVKGVEIAGMNGWSDPLRYFDGSIPEVPPVLVKPRYYRVMPGDSLWKIAFKFYHDGYQWRRIYLANRDAIKDPALIYPFQKIIIP